jgi:hypothetical protein
VMLRRRRRQRRVVYVKLCNKLIMAEVAVISG